MLFASLQTTRNRDGALAIYELGCSDLSHAILETLWLPMWRFHSHYVRLHQKAVMPKRPKDNGLEGGQ